MQVRSQEEVNTYFLNEQPLKFPFFEYQRNESGLVSERPSQIWHVSVDEIQ